jgi:hypothetical protein
LHFYLLFFEKNMIRIFDSLFAAGSDNMGEFMYNVIWGNLKSQQKHIPFVTTVIKTLGNDKKIGLKHTTRVHLPKTKILHFISFTVIPPYSVLTKTSRSSAKALVS